MVETQRDFGNSVIRSSAIPHAMSRSPFRVMPISVNSLICLRVLGWVVAMSGVIAGIVMLAIAPEHQSPVKFVYLSISWMLIISSIAGGVLLNVVAGIGSAVLDIWLLQQNSQEA